MQSRIVVKINDVDDTAELVVAPEWFSLSDSERQGTWDAAVRLAQANGYFLTEALFPAADPRHCMHIDPDGTEHHYLARKS